MKVAFFTLGCKVNQYDTQSMTELFQAAGHEIVPFDGIADAYIVNTCSVTSVSDKKSRQMIARAHRANPDAVVAVAGCFAQKDAAAALSLPGVRAVIGTDDRLSIVDIVQRASDENTVNAVIDIKNIRKYERITVDGNNDKTRALIKIQEGCSAFCAYCIIPYLRGAPRSRPVEDIAREAGRLREAGYKEAVVTGIHIGSYGVDMQNVSLTDAVKAVSEAGFERVRLGSLEPGALSESDIEKFHAMRNVCPHFHVSLQSGSDGVLKRMRRKYDKREYTKAISLLRNIYGDVTVTTDIMTGFPGETQQEHEESLRFVEEMNFLRIHVFPYSPREDTPAATMPGQVQKAVKEARAKEMAELGEKLHARWLQNMTGKEVEVLFEQMSSGGMAEGFTPGYMRAGIFGGRYEQGEIKRVTVSGVENGILIAQEMNNL